MRNVRVIYAAVLIGSVAALGLLYFYVKEVFFAGTLFPRTELNTANDVSRLNETRVARVVWVDSIETLQSALTEARAAGKHVSIAGARHSMGGHTLYPDGVLLDMRGYTQVLHVDQGARTVTVQSGATWDDVIRAVHPHGLSVPVLQDYSNFTVGGSLSVNIHQSDPNYGSMMETVRACTILLPSGEIVRASRTENRELFNLVNGGYGLFGVILEVELDLTDNNLYQKSEVPVAYGAYNDYFDGVLEDSKIENVFARLSIVPDASLLRDMVVTTYRVADEGTVSPTMELEESQLWMKKFFFDLSRATEAGKRLRWYFQKNYSDLAEPPLITRNNLDYNDASFLDYHSESDTDVLQEYFFPRSELVPFLDALRETVVKENINLLSATVRYIPPRDEGFIHFAHPTEERFAVVLYMNIGRSPAEQEKVTVWTRHLIDTTLALGGTYYLPYGLYASHAQLVAAYPRMPEFFSKKRQYDPEELIMNKFYAHYAGGGDPDRTY